MDPKNNLVGVEESAVKIIKRAIELERKNNLQPALTCYQEGIDLLLDVLKGSQDKQKRLVLRSKLEEYMGQAEKIKATISRQKDEGKYHVQININDNDTGYSYEKVFTPYFGETVTEIWIEDPYIRTYHQICNFLRFCELAVSCCNNLKTINLRTSSGNENSEQVTHLTTLKSDLSSRGITLNTTFCESMHDREFRLNNGWIIKVGRGLDYFKRADKFTLGFFDMNQRKCHQTTIDIFHSSKTVK